MAKKKVRVRVPRSAPELIELAKRIVAKDMLAGDSAKVNLFAGIDMEDLKKKISIANEEHVRSLQLKKDGETSIETRNKVLGIAKDQMSSTDGTVYFFVKAIRDVLLGSFKGREHKLGDWGFEVINSSKRSGDVPPAGGA